jgi:DNA-binding SARP family transcriptional activator
LQYTCARKERTMSRLTLYLLGPPRLERSFPGGRTIPVDLQYQKNVALLAYLAVAGPGPGGKPHTRESLITLLWPALEPSRARANLRRNLSLLRKALGEEWLVVDGEMVGLDPESDLWLDVDQFRQRLAACETHGHPPTEACPDCLPLLEEAVGLYRDHFLSGFTLGDSAAFDEWQFFETEGLKDKLAGALVRLTTYHTSLGDFEAAIGYARRWLALDPLHEPAHRCLMALYAQAGQYAAAVRQYRECMRVLEEELDLSPAGETTALYERIRAERARPPEKETISHSTVQVESTCAWNGLGSGWMPCAARTGSAGSLSGTSGFPLRTRFRSACTPSAT